LVPQHSSSAGAVTWQFCDEFTVPSLDDWEKELGEKFTTQRATKVAVGGFPVAVGCHRAIELILQYLKRFTPSE
jgi:hypothetical protein